MKKLNADQRFRRIVTELQNCIAVVVNGTDEVSVLGSFAVDGVLDPDKIWNRSDFREEIEEYVEKYGENLLLHLIGEYDGKVLGTWQCKPRR